MRAKGDMFDLTHQAKDFELFLNKVESGIFKKTKSGLAIQSSMDATYINSHTIMFLKNYTDIGITHIGVVDVRDFTSFASGSKRFFKYTIELCDNLVKMKEMAPPSFFVGLLPSATDSSGWVNVAMEIEDHMKLKLVFIVETYETARGKGSTCFVSGTAWLMPSDCGRPSLKAWVDHSNQAQFKHESISMPAVSLGSAVYKKIRETSAQDSFQPLSSLRKSEGASADIQRRGDVCEAAGWTYRGVDQLFQQEFWVKETQSPRGRRMMYASLETPATIKTKVAACSRIGGVAVVDADLDMNCANEQWELLKIIKEQCQSGK